MTKADRFDRGNAMHQAHQLGYAADSEPAIRDISTICNNIGKRFSDSAKVELLAQALWAYEQKNVTRRTE